jgi:hypothetical protein
VPRVSSPSELGIGRGAGKLGALDLPKRRATATAETFGAGVQEVRYSPEAFGAGLEYHPHQAAKSGFELLADTVAKIASVGSQTFEKVNEANNAAQIQQAALQASTEWTEQNLAREATIEEGADPGEYAKTAAAAFDEWAAKKTADLGGIQKLEMEQHLGQLKLRNMEAATSFQAQRARQHREVQNKATFAATETELKSYYNAVLTDPAQLPILRQRGLDTIDAAPGLADDVKIELRRDLIGGLAGAMWAGKVETDPYGTRDAMLRGDVGELAGLEVGDRIKYLHAAQQDIRGLESEARAAAREAKAAERERIQGIKDDQRWRARDLHDSMMAGIHSLETGRPLPPEVAKTFSTEAERQIDAAIDPDLKYTLARTLEGFQTALDTAETADVAAGIPLPQLEAEVAKRQATPISVDEGTPESVQLITMSKILAERHEALRQGKALEYAQEHSRSTQLAPVDWRDPQSSVVREEQSTKVAYLNGQPHGGDHQRLTEVEATRIAEEINGSATTDEVFAKLDGYMGRLDDNARRQWLRELKEKKLSPLVERTMEALYDRNDVQGARAIVGAMTVDPKDLPKFGDATAQEITEAVNARLTDPGNLASLSAQDARNTRQPNMRRRADEDRDAMERLTQQYVRDGQDAATAAASAERDLFGEGATAGSDDLQYVRPPQGEDAGEFTDLLERARANLVVPEFEPLPGATKGEEMYRSSNLQNIRNNGWWRQGPGGTYELVDPTTQRTVATFTPKQLRDMAGSGAEPALVLPALGF